MGRYEEARDFYQKCLEINQQCLGDQHMSTANAKSGLALVFGKLGEFEKELKLHEEVLETQVRCLGTGQCERGGYLSEHRHRSLAAGRL